MSDKMNFKSFFIGALSRDSRLQQHHFDSLKAFIKGLKLSEKEEPEKYEDALKLFFGK